MLIALTILASSSSVQHGLLRFFNSEVFSELSGFPPCEIRVPTMSVVGLRAFSGILLPVILESIFDAVPSVKLCSAVDGA